MVAYVNVVHGFSSSTLSSSLVSILSRYIRRTVATFISARSDRVDLVPGYFIEIILYVPFISSWRDVFHCTDHPSKLNHLPQLHRPMAGNLLIDPSVHDVEGIEDSFKDWPIAHHTTAKQVLALYGLNDRHEAVHVFRCVLEWHSRTIVFFVQRQFTRHAEYPIFFANDFQKRIDHA